MTGDKISTIKGVGDKRARLFHRLGVDTVDALFHFYPRNYIDYSKIKPIKDTEIGEIACVKATVITSPAENRIRKGLTLYKFKAEDNGMRLNVTIFNNKYQANKIKCGETYLFYGKIGGSLIWREMSSPEILTPDGAKIRPIYRQTDSLNTYAIEKTVKSALSNTRFDEYLPQEILDKHKLCGYDYAIRNIHFPDNFAALNKARRRLVFDELFGLQLGMRMIKQSSKLANSYNVKTDYTAEFEKLLPFSLTNAQKNAISDCVNDMSHGIMMNRLIQGDVGSGKTAVAAAVCYTAIKNGLQATMMAPTEILAEQHFASFVKIFFKTGMQVALLTGSTTAKKRAEILSQLKEGDIDLIVGTHAIIQNDVEFNRLGLVITDEQHRFGVNQRAMLSAKALNPHVMVMSATPIPRTLALMIYGDLDISILDELPPGRQPIETFVINSKIRERAFGYIKKHLDEGRQGYIVCPLVSDENADDNSNKIAAENYKDELSKNQFRGYSVGLLHGKMKSSEKEDVMRKFASGQIQLLVSTTVIEVGVDVPNSVIMMIENADLFGLSQLHQLRGRVGRGEHKSTCILVSDAETNIAKARLNVIKSTNDGFVISEEDLKLRGPGDFFGNRQHGLPVLKITNLFADIDILHETQSCAQSILDNDPTLSDPKNAKIKEIADKLKQKMAQVEMN